MLCVQVVGRREGGGDRCPAAAVGARGRHSRPFDVDSFSSTNKKKERKKKKKKKRKKERKKERWEDRKKRTNIGK